MPERDRFRSVEVSDELAGATWIASAASCLECGLGCRVGDTSMDVRDSLASVGAVSLLF